MKPLPQALIFLWKEIENIVFPPCCLLCGKPNYSIWCKECEKQIMKKALYKIEKKEELSFEKHIYLFLYEGKIRDLILDYKFHDKSYLYKVFTEILRKNEKICGILKKYDIIIPVPIHAKRKKQRGYDQSALIAKEISKIVPNLKYEGAILQKRKHTVPQSSLTKEEREQNVKNVYKIGNKEKIKKKKIVLVDDIYTTGSTANACAKLLKQQEVEEILVFTIAKD